MPYLIHPNQKVPLEYKEATEKYLKNCKIIRHVSHNVQKSHHPIYQTYDFLQFPHPGGTSFVKPATGELDLQLTTYTPVLKDKKLLKAAMAFSQIKFYLPVLANDRSFAKSPNSQSLASIYKQDLSHKPETATLINV